MGNTRIAVAALAASFLFVPRAEAQGTEAQAKAQAEQLYRQGRALARENNLAEACPKFRASLELDPALGTQANLALCYENVGRVASAWGLYLELAELAEKAGQTKRAATARERAAKLEARLPELVIVIKGEPTPGLEVTRDGLKVDPVTFGEPIYVDPGKRAIEATAPGHEPYTTTTDAVEGVKNTVEIPPLNKLSEPEPGVLPGEIPGDRDPGKVRRLSGIGAGVVGLALVGVGAGYGISAISTWNDAFDSGLCDRDTLTCVQAGKDKTDTASSRAGLSNVFIGVGLVAVGAGVALYLTAPKAERATPEQTSARVVPSAGPDGFGVSVLGRF